MTLQGLGLHQLKEGRRASGHERHHPREAGPLHLAGLADALPGMGWAVEAGDRLDKRLLLAGGIALGVAGAGLGAVAEGAVSGGNETS